MIKLDDFLSKKKEPVQVLDLSKVKISSKEEFKKYFDKIPECKVKPEKISWEQIKIKDKDFTFTSEKREKKSVREWNYPDPTPPDMKGVELQDLCPINIDWKMLTTVRPKTKVEEDMFSRLVQLGKLDLKYQSTLQREKITDWVRRTKNPKSSIIEMRVISCKECGEDFCDGSLCCKLTYENFFRPQAITSNLPQNLLLAAESEDKKVKRKKKRSRRQRKRKTKGSKGRFKKSIFNRPLSRGCTRDHSGKCKAEAVEKQNRRALSSTRSFSSERKIIHTLPARSKSAPRINLERNTSDIEFKRNDYYTSDSAPSNTDYSTQSDSESVDIQGKFFNPNLRLSGKRKLLSARVSFADRCQRREATESPQIKFVKQCSLCKCKTRNPNWRIRKSYGRYSGSSTSPCSRSISGSPKKSSSKFPSTIQIQFDDNFTSSTSVHFPKKTYSLITTFNKANKNKNSLNNKQHDLTQSVSDGSRFSITKDSKANSKKFSKRNKTREKEVSPNKFKEVCSETCLTAKGLHRKANSEQN